MERRSTAARRKRAIAARKIGRAQHILKTVQETAKSVSVQVESAFATIVAARSQEQVSVPSKALLPMVQDASGDGEDYSAIATLELPPQEQEDGPTAITWNDTWATPETETTDDRSWRWQEPSFDDEMSGVLMTRPRRSLRERLMFSVPFSMRERAWGGAAAWRRHVGLLITFAIIFLFAIVGGVLGYQQIIKATANTNLSISSPDSSATAPSGVVIMPPAVGSTTPTPSTAAYEIGTWVSNSAPTGGSVTVFVRIVQNLQGAPGIPVTVFVQSPGSSKHYGPTKTDGTGIAKFNVQFGGATSTDPVFVTATASVNGQTLSAQTTFVPSSGSTQQSGTGASATPTPGPKHHRPGR